MPREQMNICKIFPTLILTTGITVIQAEEKFTEADQLFTLKIAPLFSEKCNGCHGEDAEEIKGGLEMQTREKLLAGGDEFASAVLTPGDVAASFIIDAVKWADPDWEMPPKKNDRLSQQQIGYLEKWIEGGAPWPDEVAQEAIRTAEAKKSATSEGIIMPTSGGLGDEWTYRRYMPEDVWAFLPVEKPELPKAETTANPVDAFIIEKLSAANFEMAPEADARTLMRRASYDLIGLPPTPEEMDAFLTAWEMDEEAAWAAEIERLLASPHYGERWGQHWLDVARYADTGGLSNDYERSNAWRYRDYVIRAFNENKPYNQFVLEQIAGDEMADALVRKRVNGDEKRVTETRLKGDYTPEESELIVATGFLRMGPWDNAMVKEEEARQMYLDDVVNSVGQTFLATTMRCFKCHDHKFDPLPTKDYYRMYAAFAGTRMAERNVAFTPTENCANFENGKRHVEKMLAFAKIEKDKILKKQEDAARVWYKENGREYLTEQQRNDLPDEEKPPRYVGLDNAEQGQRKVREQDEWIWERRLERYLPMAQSVHNSATDKDAWNQARKLRIEKEANPKGKVESVIYTGGTIEAPGDVVKPGVISAIGIAVENAPSDDPYVLQESLEGRRLTLAKWIADPKNPLTTRSIVNRIWQHHFGEAIARNPNNFGVKGAKPTHPELLNWLAADFVENGWTMKRMHRLIMSSKAYRMSTRHPEFEKLRRADAGNNLLAYRTPRRLSAEEMRDSFLVATGELVEKSGGLPVSPEINMEVALQPRMIQFSLAPAYQPSTSAELRNRRTIYAYRVRGMADPMLELFNQPNPNDSCEMRDSAAVSPQAFSLLNSDLVTDRSIALAKRLESEAGADVDVQISLAFQRVLGRAPDAGELSRLKIYLEEMRAYQSKVTPAKVSYPAKITRTLVEEFSGEPFDYEEILPAFENYQPDIKAADVDGGTRALADLCLLLFNVNEFIYVY